MIDKILDAFGLVRQSEAIADIDEALEEPYQRTKVGFTADLDMEV